MTKNLGFNVSIDFLEQLKNRTSFAHRQLESLPISASILSHDLKIADYAHYLSLMHDVHKSLQDRIYPLLSNIISDLKERKKTNLIENDLSYLNYKKDNIVPVFNNQEISIPFALGILYVVEGSSLGGRFILKNIETIPRLDTQNGVSYFTGYGNKTGSYWKAFLNALTAYETEFNCADEIIEGAVYAFDAIHNHFLNTVRNEN